MARGRPVTPIGSHGEVSVRQLPSGKWEASTRLRLFNGSTVRIRARGQSATAARRAAEERCAQRLQAEDNEQLSTSSKLSLLLDTWREQHDVSESSKDTYKKCIDKHISPGIGDLRINELNTQRVQMFLETLKPGTAKTARAVLGSACGMAVRWAVMSRNPVPDTKLKTPKRQAVRALTDEEITEYQTAVKVWCGSNPMGTKRGEGLLEIVDVLRGSGMRIGEVLGLVWSNVDFDAGTVTVNGQTDNKGGRKQWPKTESSNRTIVVKACAMDALRRQRDKGYHEHLGEYVFPTRNGTTKSVANVNGDLRQARGELDIIPHDFRKTVSTRIEATHGVLAASRYLGHSSTKVTEQYYLAKPKEVPNYTDAF